MPVDQPKLSTTMPVAALLDRHTSPPLKPTTVKLGTISPARKFTVDASGGAPQGYTTTKPSNRGSTTVMFRATAPNADR